MTPYMSHSMYPTCIKSTMVTSSVDSLEFNDNKNCKLCRKKLHNSHFYNPKNGLLFSVCDICRKRKRDKYWMNKELLQHSTIDTRLSTRQRQYRQRRDNAISNTLKVNDSVSSSSPSSPDAYSSSPYSQSSQDSYASQFANHNVFTPPPNCQKERKGTLIIVPPQVSNFLLSNVHKPDYVRSCIGDYYWDLLCPHITTSCYDGYRQGIY